MSSEMEVLAPAETPGRAEPACATDNNAPCQLYRHYAADGTLLYVGISLSAVARLCQHRNDATWFPQIRHIEIETFPTRKKARRAELKAIREEAPLHNKDGVIAPEDDTLLQAIKAEALVQYAQRSRRVEKWQRLKQKPDKSPPRRRNHNLMLRHRTWFLKVSIPPSVRHAFPSGTGKPRSEIVESLKTHDVAIARELRDIRLAEWRKRFSEIRQRRRRIVTRPTTTSRRREVLTEKRPISISGAERRRISQAFAQREQARGRPGHAQPTSEPTAKVFAGEQFDARELKALISRGFSEQTAREMLAGRSPRPERYAGHGGWQF